MIKNNQKSGMAPEVTLILNSKTNMNFNLGVRSRRGGQFEGG